MDRYVPLDLIIRKGVLEKELFVFFDAERY